MENLTAGRQYRQFFLYFQRPTFLMTQSALFPSEFIAWLFKNIGTICILYIGEMILYCHTRHIFYMKNDTKRRSKPPSNEQWSFYEYVLNLIPYGRLSDGCSL